MDVIKLAKEAGFTSTSVERDPTCLPLLEHFAALVRAEALEEAAELGDSLDPLQDGAIAATIRGLK